MGRSKQIDIRKLREGQGVSLRRLAQRLEIHPSHLSRVERQHRAPSVALLARIAAELGLKELAGTLTPYRGERP